MAIVHDCKRTQFLFTIPCFICTGSPFFHVLGEWASVSVVSQTDFHSHRMSQPAPRQRESTTVFKGFWGYSAQYGRDVNLYLMSEVSNTWIGCVGTKPRGDVRKHNKALLQTPEVQWEIKCCYLLISHETFQCRVGNTRKSVSRCLGLVETSFSRLFPMGV